MRSRIIYGGVNIFASTSPSWEPKISNWDIKKLKRIQSSSISISAPVSRSKQIGYSSFAYETNIESPSVQVNFSYLASDNSNELILGMNATGENCFIQSLSSAQKDINLLFLISESDADDADAAFSHSYKHVLGVGNAFLGQYSVQAEAGAFPTTNLVYDCLEASFNIYSGSGSSSVPSIDLRSGVKSSNPYSLEEGNFTLSNYLTNQSARPSAIKPGNIVLELQQPVIGGARYSGVLRSSISSFDIQIPIERRDLVGFGSNYPFDKKIMFPLVGTVNFNGIFDQPEEIDLSDVFSSINSSDLSFNFFDEEENLCIKYSIANAKIESQEFNISIDNMFDFKGSFSFEISKNGGFSISGQSSLV